MVLAVLLLHALVLRAVLRPPAPPQPAGDEARVAVRAVAPPVAAPPAAAAQRTTVPMPVPPAPSPRPAPPTPPAAIAQALTRTPVLLPDAAGGTREAGSLLPQRPVRLAPPFEAGFTLQRGGLDGEARLALAFDGPRYTLTLDNTLPGRPNTHSRSSGRGTLAGLAPERYVEGRQGRDRRAVNFVREPAGAGGSRLLFSDHEQALPLPEGTQDRLSWLVQLAGLVDADPAAARQGLALWVAGPRGQLDLWQFQVTEAASPVDGRPALKLGRAAGRPWDLELELWLDPAERHLPLVAAWRLRDGARVADEQRLERRSLRWSAPGP